MWRCHTGGKLLQALRISQGRAFTSLPVIDISPLVLPDQTVRDKAAVASSLHAACRDVGFFYVVNHGIPKQVQEGVLADAREWFMLPESIKSQISLRPDAHYRGYQGLGTNVTRFDGGFQRDWHEAIDLYREEAPQSPVQALDSRYSPIHGPNQWPHQLPRFEQSLRRYLQEMVNLGSTVMQGIALGLNLPQHFFNRSTSPSYWCARVIHYPPLAQGTEHQAAGPERGIRQEAVAARQGAEVDRSVQLSCGEHTDYGLLTFVNQEPHVTALQVKNAAGQWIAADPVPGAFVCNIGDMLKVWSNGLYQPTAHRVINSDPTQSRVSIPFFFEPSYEAVVKPLQQLCTSASPPRYSGVRYGDHLESKVLNNFEL